MLLNFLIWYNNALDLEKESECHQTLEFIFKI